MTMTGPFKTYRRDRRQYLADAKFSGGMMYSGHLLDEGYVKTLVNYDIKADGEYIKPRPGIRLKEIVLPELNLDFEANKALVNQRLTILDSKDCIEDGKIYRQFILGRKNSGGGMPVLGVVTNKVDGEQLETEVGNLIMSLYKTPVELYSTPFPQFKRDSVHGMRITEHFVESYEAVGTFGFGNSYYFIGLDKSYKSPKDSLFYTVFNPETERYDVKPVVPKTLSPSEAVTYGYNMLLGAKAYDFSNEPLEGSIQFTGILPYSTKSQSELLMTPRHNEDLYLKCFFKGQVGKSYKFVWEWRHVGEDNWVPLQSLEQSPVYTIQEGPIGDVVLQSEGRTLSELKVTFKAPTADILVRVQAYAVEEGVVADTVEKAMTVGFDFSINTYGSTTNVTPETYDLATCTGVEFWQNRLVLYGNPKDAKVLFISDVNDPSYFPYPNNISIYDEDIICVKAFMDSLLVFTTTQIHQVSLNDDGATWSSTVVQSNLHIAPKDKHLIQVVKNMVYFKSGDYYFMEVPKAQSTTGELILAPVSSAMTDFFDKFEHNICSLIQDCYGYEGSVDLVHYYNYLDYEDIHNVYLFKTDNTPNYLNVDLLYNTSDRTWRIYCYESDAVLYPYRQDATQKGQLVSSTVFRNTCTDVCVVEEFEPDSIGLTTSKKVWAKNIACDFKKSDTIHLWLSSDDGDFFNWIKFQLQSSTSTERVFMTAGYKLVVDVVEKYSDYADLCNITLIATGNQELPIGCTLSVEPSNLDLGPIIVDLQMEPVAPTTFLYPTAKFSSGDFIEVFNKRYTLIEDGADLVPSDDSEDFVIGVDMTGSYRVDYKAPIENPSIIRKLEIKNQIVARTHKSYGYPSTTMANGVECLLVSDYVVSEAIIAQGYKQITNDVYEQSSDSYQLYPEGAITFGVPKNFISVPYDGYVYEDGTVFLTKGTYYMRSSSVDHENSNNIYTIVLNKPLCDEVVPIRGIQVYGFDIENPKDLRIDSSSIFEIRYDKLEEGLKYNSELIKEAYVNAQNSNNVAFQDWQFVDTGFRKDNFVRNKRYREVQFQLNNIDGVNLEFGLEFQIDGQPRLTYYSYDIEHIVDYSDPNYGLIYIQGNVDMNLPTTYIRTPNETTLGPGSNSWILNQSLFPELNLWKIRASVSGKGIAPRIRLVSRNPNNYELFSINWIYRLMNAR